MHPVIEARDVSKRFFLRHNRAGELKVRVLDLVRRRDRGTVEEFWALRRLSLTIRQGEALGIVGRNGSGKSTLLKLIAGIHRPTTGTLRLARYLRIGSLIELGVGFHPELTGRENVFLNASIHGLQRADIEAIYADVVEYSGLRHFMDVPLKNYSSGMNMRLGFAVAAKLDPDVLILDEIFAVGDEAFQRRCMKTLDEFQARAKTTLFVSHSTAAIQAVCHRVCLLDRGRIRYDGDVDGGLSAYKRLLSARPATEVRPDSEADADLVSAELDQPWHRLALGANWEELGRWAFDFTRRQGLGPRHYLMDVGCGSLSAGVLFLKTMEANRYWGFEKNRELFEAGVMVEAPRAGVRPERGHFIVNDAFDLSSCPDALDFAIANSLFRRLSLNAVAACVASVVRQLGPDGRFFATWLEAPEGEPFAERRWPGGLTSFPDREPYHYSFDMLASVCEAVGARADRVDDHSHPDGESILLIRRVRPNRP